MNRQLVKRYLQAVAILATALWVTSSFSDDDYYSSEDFNLIEKIDAHVHLNSENPALVEQALKDNFKLLTVNVDYSDFPPVEDQYETALALKARYPETVYFASTFSVSDWADHGKTDDVVAGLQRAQEKGAVAVKIWKNIGMDIRDHKGQLIMVDDSKLDPFFSFLERQNIPLIGHQGEPRNCWLSFDQMTVNNDREYFQEHPQYHMFLHPELPSYEDQMAARDRRLQKNPDLPFVGAHLASLEWSVSELALFLDRHPRALVDTAARMGQLQVQSRDNREQVRAFFLKYQDRLIYATDLTFLPDDVGAEAKTIAHTKWMEDWLFLSTDQTMTVPEVNGEFSGLRLPRPVINKLYALNARVMFDLP